MKSGWGWLGVALVALLVCQSVAAVQLYKETTPPAPGISESEARRLANLAWLDPLCRRLYSIQGIMDYLMYGEGISYQQRSLVECMRLAERKPIGENVTRGIETQAPKEELERITPKFKPLSPEELKGLQQKRDRDVATRVSYLARQNSQECRILYSPDTLIEFQLTGKGISIGGVSLQKCVDRGKEAMSSGINKNPALKVQRERVVETPVVTVKEFESEDRINRILDFAQNYSIFGVDCRHVYTRDELRLALTEGIEPEYMKKMLQRQNMPSIWACLAHGELMVKPKAKRTSPQAATGIERYKDVPKLPASTGTTNR